MHFLFVVTFILLCATVPVDVGVDALRETGFDLMNIIEYASTQQDSGLHHPALRHGSSSRIIPITDQSSVPNFDH